MIVKKYFRPKPFGPKAYQTQTFFKSSVPGDLRVFRAFASLFNFFSQSSDIFNNVKPVQNFQHWPNMSKLSKIKNRGECPSLSTLSKIVKNCQNYQYLSKFV